MEMLARMSLGGGVGADGVDAVDDVDRVVVVVVVVDDVVVVDSMAPVSPGSLPLAGAPLARPVSLSSPNFVLWFLRHPPTDLFPP